MSLQNLRGFRDIYPEDMLIKRKIFDKMHDTAKSYGFKEIDTPSVEHLDLFKKKSGDEITNQVFSFKDKGDRQVSLIPETTPSIARMFVTKKNMTRPVKWYSISKLWRYEEPQSGRTREFYQFNADIIGSKSIKADFEIIALASETLDKLGLKGKYTIDISDRIILEGILKKLGIQNITEAFKLIDKREKLTEEEFIKLMRKLCNKDDAEYLNDILKIKGSFKDVIEELKPFTPDKERIETMLELENLLDLYNISNVSLNLSVVRGLAYYTGIVFEAHDLNRKSRAILGGGRYDNLINLFDGPETPAVGFGMGDVILELLMKKEKVQTEDFQVDYFIASEKEIDKSIKIAKSLRQKGHVVEIDLLDRSLAKQLKYANNINAKKVIILKDNTKEVIVKDMKSGEQVSEKLSNYL